MSRSPREVARILSLAGSLSAKSEDQQRGFTAQKVDGSAWNKRPVLQPALPGRLALLGAHRTMQQGSASLNTRVGLAVGPWGKGPQLYPLDVPLAAPPPKQRAWVIQSWERLRGGRGQGAGQTPRLLSAAISGCFWPQCKNWGCPPCVMGQRSQDLPFLTLKAHVDDLSPSVFFPQRQKRKRARRTCAGE